MKNLKNLIKGTIIGGLMACVISGFYDFNKEKYNIDGNKVVVSDAVFNRHIKEIKGENKVKHVRSPSNWKYNHVEINGMKYDSEDSLVYSEALKRYGYLMEKIDSIDGVEKESRLQKKLDRELKDLEILKK